MKSYWLFIEPHTFLKKINDDIILFNPFTSEFLEYRKNKKIASLFSSEFTKITEKEMKEAGIMAFIKKVTKFNLCELIDSSMFNDLPINLNTYSEQHFMIEERETASIFLKELTIYLNEECKLNCPFCDHAFKQFLYCSKLDEKKQEIEFNIILDIFESGQSHIPVHLNIVGGNIFDYSHLNDLIKKLNTFASSKMYWIESNHINSKIRQLLNKIEKKKSKIALLINPDTKRTMLHKSLMILKEINLGHSVQFIIRTTEDIISAKKLIAVERINDYVLRPLYTGDNISFFKDKIFFSVEEILKKNNSLQTIMLKSIYNMNDCGKLTILPNGDVYTNINTSIIGSLYLNSLNDIIVNELKERGNWFKTRSSVFPCKNCIYNCLCPPISNYEYAIGKNNLCHINQSITNI